MADDSDIQARLAIALEARISQFEKAMDRAQAKANGAMSTIEGRVKQTEAKLQNSIKTIELEHQLDVARARGNSKVVEELGEEIALRRQIARLTAAGLAQAEAQALAEKQIHALATARAGSEGISGAARFTLDRTRLAVFEEGGAKLGVYGGALEKLGASGLAAAAALAAVGLSAEEAHKALEWANELDNQARRLHVTAEALQQYRFAMEEVGGAEHGADEGLESFSSTLGKAQAGLPKALRAFKELGFSVAEVKSFETVEQALDAVTERIAKLKSNPQKDAVIDQLGLTGMKPLIEAGIEKMQELRGEARELGIVMENELVSRGAELNKQYEALSKVVGTQLKEAFIGLGPVIVAVLQKTAEFARDINDFIQGFKPPNERSTSSLAHNFNTVSRKAAGDRALANSLDSRVPGSGLPWRMQAGAERGKAAEDLGELVRRIAQPGQDERPDLPTGGAELEDVSKGGAKVHDQTLSMATTIADRLADAQKRLAEAQAALTDDVMEHAKLEKDAVDAELKKQTQDLNKSRSELDKGVADGSINAEKAKQLRAEIEQTGLANEAAAKARQRNIDLGAQFTIEQKALERAKAVAGYDDQVRSIAIAMSATRQERLRLQLEQLDADKALADRARKDERDKAAARGAPGDGDIVVTYDARQAAADRAYRAQKAQVEANNLSPFQKWAKDGEDAAKNINDVMENEAVKGIDTFNDHLIDSEGRIRNVGDALSTVWKMGLADLERYLLKQAEVGLFGGGQGGGSLFGGLFSTMWNALPKFADGGVVGGVGGPRSDNILARLSPGEVVIPNGVSIPRAGSGATVNQFFSLDARGAMTTEEFVAGLKSYTDSVGAQAAQVGAQAGHQMTMDRLSRQSRNRLGA